METIQKERFTVENVRQDIKKNVEYEKIGKANSFVQFVILMGIAEILVFFYDGESKAIFSVMAHISFFPSLICYIIFEIMDIKIRRSLNPKEIYFTKSTLERKYTGTTTVQKYTHLLVSVEFPWVVNEEVECYLFDFTGGKTYRVRFKLFLFSKSYHMSSKALCLSSEIGDKFYLVRRRDSGEVIFAYPEKLFFPDESIKIENTD